MSQGLFGAFHTNVMLQRLHLYLLLFQPFAFFSVPMIFNCALLLQLGHWALSFTIPCNCSRSERTTWRFLAWALSCSTSLSQVSSICLYSSPSLFSMISTSPLFLK